MPVSYWVQHEAGVMAIPERQVVTNDRVILFFEKRPPLPGYSIEFDRKTGQAVEEFWQGWSLCAPQYRMNLEPEG